MVRPENSRYPATIEFQLALFKEKYSPTNFVDSAILLLQTSLPIDLLDAIIDHMVEQKHSEVTIITYIGQLIRSSLTNLEHDPVGGVSNSSELLKHIYQIYAANPILSLGRLREKIHTAWDYTDQGREDGKKGIRREERRREAEEKRIKAQIRKEKQKRGNEQQPNAPTRKACLLKFSFFIGLSSRRRLPGLRQLL